MLVQHASKRLVGSMLLLISFVLAGCSTLPFEDIIKEAPPYTFRYGNYVIGKGDSILVDVWRNPELTRTLNVRPDGFITMPLMGDIQADGRRPEELADIISEGLMTVIKSPEVSVTVVGTASIEYLYRVRVMGEVAQPTSLPFTQGITVMDLVLAAGGVTPFGAGNRAILSRLTSEGYKDFLVDLDAILKQGDTATNYPLQPTDVLTIPEKDLWRGEF